MRGVNIRAILADPKLRKKMTVGAICFIQAVEGIDTTQQQASDAYDRIRNVRQ